jgi:hypothetical protein
MRKPSQFPGSNNLPLGLCISVSLSSAFDFLQLISTINGIRQKYLQFPIIKVFFNFHHTFLGFRFFFFLFGERTSESCGLTSHLAFHWTNRLEGGFPSIQLLSLSTQPILQTTLQKLYSSEQQQLIFTIITNCFIKNSVAQSLSASHTSCSSSSTSVTCKTS